jgi:hypothetical protein
MVTSEKMLPNVHLKIAKITQKNTLSNTVGNGKDKIVQKACKRLDTKFLTFAKFCRIFSIAKFS